MNRFRPFAWPCLLFAALGGCATRQEGARAAGERDARREEIARLDRQIAQEEVDLGLRRAPPPADTYAEQDAEPAQEPSVAGGQAEPPGTPPGVPRSPSPPPPTMTPEPDRPMTRFAEPPPGPAAAGDSCHRVCRSVEAICNASARICRLADGLDDAWADGRCEAATRSCASAEHRAESRCAGSCR